jgi:hypothetical protein
MQASLNLYLYHHFIISLAARASSGPDQTAKLHFRHFLDTFLTNFLYFVLLVRSLTVLEGVGSAFTEG